MARGLKFQIQKVKGLYYPYSENKGADQLGGYREADLRLCFRIYAKSRFSHDEAHLLHNNAERSCRAYHMGCLVKDTCNI